MERFTGLNIHGFSPMKFFLRKYFRGALATSVHYLPKAKNSRENFHGKLTNHENSKSLAQRIFPRLQHNNILIKVQLKYIATVSVSETNIKRLVCIKVSERYYIVFAFR